jgi:hypothetical protein
MVRQLGVRFWLKSITAGLSAGLGILTLFWKDWIEGVFGVDPDNHSGSLEWLVVIGPFALAVLFSLTARAEWQRTRRLLIASQVNQ